MHDVTPASERAVLLFGVKLRHLILYGLLEFCTVENCNFEKVPGGISTLQLSRTWQ